MAIGFKDVYHHFLASIAEGLLCILISRQTLLAHKQYTTTAEIKLSGSQNRTQIHDYGKWICKERSG